MKRKAPDKELFVIFFFAFLSNLIFINLLGHLSETQHKRIYTNVESLRTEIRNIPVGISKETKIDLNKDNVSDYLIYTYAGEEIDLLVLLSDQQVYVLQDIPGGEEYELFLSTKGRFILRIGHAPIPGFGNNEPGDYCNYDHYEFSGNKAILVNENYPSLYKKMIDIYQTRTEEIKKHENDREYDFIFGGKIKKYNEFVKRALGIIHNAHDDYSEFSRAQEDVQYLIGRYFPDFGLLGDNDLNTRTKVYYDKHIVNFSPFLVAKDINADALLDYGLLLKEKSRQDNQVLFVIAVQKDNGQFDIVYESKYDNSDKDLFIVPITPWKFGWYKIDLKSPAFGLCCFKKPTGTIYWWDEQKGKISESAGEEILCCR